MSYVIQVCNKEFWFHHPHERPPTTQAEAEDHIAEQVRRYRGSGLFKGVSLRWVEIDDQTGDVAGYGPWTPPRPEIA